MLIDGELTDQAVLGEVGRRLARVRLERNIGQSELAAEAGVGLATLQRLERGRSVALTNVIRVLRALDLLETLDRAVPEPLPSPIEELQLRGRRRQRAGSPRTARASETASEDTWRWGDEGGTAA